MILLILLSSSSSSESSSSFKFHYDSINSAVLNYTKVNNFYLNSIMILLIRLVQDQDNLYKEKLKFHYDSINSDTLFRDCFSLASFKFHYDSINSVPKSSPYLSQKTSLFCRPLQNSTFLSCP